MIAYITAIAPIIAWVGGVLVGASIVGIRNEQRNDERAKDDEPTGTEAAVCHDIAARQRRGIQKYSTTVADNPIPLRAWMQHAYEEALDFAIYLKRAIQKYDELDRRQP